MSHANISIQKTILYFLDKTGAIDGIKEQCEHFKTAGDSAFQFQILVDPTELLEIDATLGNFVLNNPTGACKLFQEVVYGIVESLSLLPTCSSPSQVVVVFKLLSLPNLPSCEIGKSVEFLKHAGSKRFVQYRGIVVGMTTPHKYTKSARFVCREEQCEGAEGNHFIRVHIPGALETQTIRSGFCCSFCGSPLIEDVQCRVLADKIVVELIDEDAFHCESWRRYQSLTTYLRDELISGIEIGQTVHIIGLPILDVNNRVLALEANKVTIAISALTKEPEVKLTIPPSIARILKDREGSAWSFPLSLAYALAGSVTPPGTFLHLKLGLLLSLLNQSIDIVAVSTDGGEMVGRLLRQAASLSPRYVLHTATSILTAATNKHTPSGEALIHGGSLLLARGGMCVVQDITEVLKKPALNTLLQAVERKQVSVELPSKLSSDSLGQSIRLPRRCAVWASYTPTGKPEDPKTIHMLANAFRMVYPVDVGVATYADHLITRHTLMSAMMPASDVIEHQDIHEFVSVVRCRDDPELSEAAECLIRGYYVGSRSVRGGGMDSDANIPITAVHTITRLSVAHAKLCLRGVVLDTDAAAAIRLYEESITAITGYSVLNIHPAPHIKDNNIQAYIGEENDRNMLKFLQHLQLFIANHADTTHSFFTPANDDYPEE